MTVTKSGLLLHGAPPGGRDLRRRGGLGIHPVRSGVQQKPRTKGNTIPEYLTPDEVVALLRAAPSVQARLLMLIMWRAGLRVSEALALRRSDLVLDAPDPVLRVRNGKGNRPRLVPVHAELGLALSTALAFQPASEGEPLVRASRVTALRWIGQARRQLEASGALQPGRRVGNHTLRHSAARHWLASGVPINIVQRWLGHARLETTLIYLQVLPNPGGAMERVP